MTLIGYSMMCEQAAPKQLVRDVALAEESGFDCAVISDHHFPRLESQGHSPYARSVLGAAAQATHRNPGDLRHLPDPPLSTRRRRAKGGDHATVIRWPVHPRPGRRRESQRTHCQRAMAAHRPLRGDEVV